MRTPPVCRGGFTSREALVVLSIVGLLGFLVGPALSAAREESRLGVCLNNQRQIMLAILMEATANDNGIVFGAAPARRIRGKPEGTEAEKAQYKVFQEMGGWEIDGYPPHDDFGAGFHSRNETYPVRGFWMLMKNGYLVGRHELFRCPTDERIEAGEEEMGYLGEQARYRKDSWHRTSYLMNGNLAVFYDHRGEKTLCSETWPMRTPMAKALAVAPACEFPVLLADRGAGTLMASWRPSYWIEPHLNAEDGNGGDGEYPEWRWDKGEKYKWDDPSTRFDESSQWLWPWCFDAVERGSNVAFLDGHAAYTPDLRPFIKSDNCDGSGALWAGGKELHEQWQAAKWHDPYEPQRTGVKLPETGETEEVEDTQEDGD